MSLITDKQTVEDLGIFTRDNKDSVFSIFNKTRTSGGAEILEKMLRYPLSDQQLINKRASIISGIGALGLSFSIPGELLDVTEGYLANRDERNRLTQNDHTLARKLSGILGADTPYRQIVKGIVSTIDVLKIFNGFLEQLGTFDSRAGYHEEIAEMKKLLEAAGLRELMKEKIDQQIPYDRAVFYDNALRYQYHNQLMKILEAVYLLDAYFSIAQVAAQRGFVFAEAVDGKEPFVALEGLVHPGLSTAVANDLTIAPGSNIVFLTGANMAGKSTFMKAFGIAMYLAHAGFPVAAQTMRFSVCEAILTTINLADNLLRGYSHFYSEVLRLRKMALQLSGSKNVLIITDELFRGTNVKDAYEGTVAVTRAFASRLNCMFLVSTHITEAGEALAGLCPNIQFVFFPTRIEALKPVYTHKIEKGITKDRFGMVIIENEGILDILRNGQKQSTPK